MDFLIFIFLIVWVISTMSKSAKEKAAAVKRPLSTQAEDTVPQGEQTTLQALDDNSMQPIPMIAESMGAPTFATQRNLYQGSMNADTHEGEDACHPRDGDTPYMKEMHSRLENKKRMEHRLKVHSDMPNHYDHPHGEEHDADDLDFSPKGVRQAFIMNEILTRPCEKRRNGYAPRLR